MDPSFHQHFSVWHDGKSLALQNVFHPLSGHHHKGSAGRVAIVGGSDRYTGAPYYAAMAALRTGADLVTVYTAHEAALPIKCYSPELMVQPIYKTHEMKECVLLFSQEQDGIHQSETSCDSRNSDCPIIQQMVHSVTEQMDRYHCLVIGPGLGRCPAVLYAISRIVQEARRRHIYIVLDADALFMLAQPQYRKLLKGYTRAILTPNIMEYQRLFADTTMDKDDFDDVTIVLKGAQDQILRNGQTLMTCTEKGGWKRAGGIGDVLSGTLGTVVAWRAILDDSSNEKDNNNNSASNKDWLPLTCWTACCILKRATKQAFEIKRRAMSATDVLAEVGSTIDAMELIDIDQKEAE